MQTYALVLLVVSFITLNLAVLHFLFVGLGIKGKVKDFVDNVTLFGAACVFLLGVPYAWMLVLERFA